VYGDPVNSPPQKKAYTVVRRSERLKQVAVEEDNDATQDEDDDMASYAEALAAEMRAQGILDEIDE
jgi:hypothetical protein